jgi:DNA-binding winged helix-turn-helix (wHTH) protein
MADPSEVFVGPFRILRAKRDLLLRDGERPKLPPKVFELLLYLAERSDQVISRDQLLADLWPGRIVEANALNQVIFQARLALNDHRHELLVTYPKRGFWLRLEDEVEPTSVDSTSGGTADESRRIGDTADESRPIGDTADEFLPASIYFDKILQSETVKSVQDLGDLPHVSMTDNGLAGGLIQARLESKKVKSKATARNMLMVLVVAVAGIWVWRSNAPIETTYHAPIASTAKSSRAVVFAPTLPSELRELMEAAARGVRLETAVLTEAADLAKAKLSVGTSSESEGLLLTVNGEERFILDDRFLEEYLKQLAALASESELAPSALGRNQLASAGRADNLSRSDEAALDALFLAESKFSDVYNRVLQRVEADPFDREPWQAAAILLHWSGKTASAAKLQNQPSKSAPSTYSSSAKAQWLNSEIQKARRFEDVQLEALQLKAVCADQRIQRQSWAQGICLLEQALAERRASRTNDMLASFALAADAFRHAEDEASAAQVDELAKIAFQPNQEVDLKQFKVEDGRALGLWFRPLLFEDPSMAFTLAQKAELKPWVRNDPVSHNETWLVMAQAARMLDDKQKIQSLIGAFGERIKHTKARGALFESRATLLDLYYAQGDLRRAVDVRRQMQQDPEVIRIGVRCRTALIFIESQRAELVEDDLEICFKNRFDRTLYAHFVGFYAWTGKILQQRLNNQPEQAKILFENALLEYKAALLDQSVDPSGHQALSTAQFFITEAWALRQMERVDEICAVQPEACSFEPFAQLIQSEKDPSALKELELPKAAQVVNAAELLMPLYVEQKRLGRCPISPALLEEYIDRFRSQGYILSLVHLESMRGECDGKQVSAALERSRSYLTY